MVFGKKKKDKVVSPPVPEVSKAEQDEERKLIESEGETDETTEEGTEPTTEEADEELTDERVKEVLQNFEMRLRRIEYHLRI